jgi:hypothetical protein
MTWNDGGNNMERSGWEHYELEKEMMNSDIAQLLNLFKRENEKYTAKCMEYVQIFDSLNEEGKKQLEDHCKLLSEAKSKVALVIAERLTIVKRIKN